MDKKLFHILIAIVVLPLLFISELKAQATNLTVLLETENDTLYYNQEGGIIVTVYKDSWFPSRIKIQRQIRTAANASKIGAICLEVYKEGKDTFRVQGGRIIRISQVTDQRSTEQVIRLQNIMIGMGIMDEIKRLGVQNGDTIVVGKLELEYWDDEVYK